MTTNELRKGTMVTLRNGWTARLEDNKKGNIRLATVYGDFTEMGSIYATDIVTAQVNGQTVRITPTASQQKAQEARAFWGF